MKTYVAQHGDRLDTITNNTYKTLDKEVLEKVLEANPYLASKPILEFGDIVNLPVIEIAKKSIEVKTLW